jgi:hypothetical protein
VAAIKGETAKARQIGIGLGMMKAEIATQAPPLAGPDTLRAFSLMELAAERGSPFITERQALALLLPHDMDVAWLDDLAREGAPTPEQLKLRFDAAAHAVERVIGSGPADGWGWLRASVPALSGANGAEAAAIVAEARIALETGDLRAATALLRDLRQPATFAFKGWSVLAERRANLDERLASLASRLNRAALGSTEG